LQGFRREALLERQIMSFLKSLFSSSKQGDKPIIQEFSSQLVMVDVAGLINQRRKNGNGHASPRDQAAVLRDIMRFASREGIHFDAVFVGRPLREAAEGVEQKGVRAYYAETQEKCNETILGLLKRFVRKNHVVVCSCDPQVEARAVALNAECMKPSTLKKAFEGNEERPRTAEKGFNGRERVAQGSSAHEKHVESARDTRDAAVLTLIDPV
jgi:hypothetical protein